MSNKHLLATELVSRYGIGASVKLHPAIGKAPGVIVGVAFREGKVTYDVNLDIGGETLRNVDSIFLE